MKFREVSGSCGSASTRPRRSWPCGLAERAPTARLSWRWRRLASPGASCTPRSLASARVTGGNYRESGAGLRSPGRVGGPRAGARTSEAWGGALVSPKKIPSGPCPSGRGTPWSSQRPRRPEAAFLGREGGRPRDHSDAFAFRTRRFRFSTRLSSVPAPSSPVSVYQNTLPK